VEKRPKSEKGKEKKRKKDIKQLENTKSTLKRRRENTHAVKQKGFKKHKRRVLEETLLSFD
jgi:hypothetical protein